MIKSAKAAEKQQSLVKVLEQEKKTLEHEINGYRQKAQQERKIIQQLEKERDRCINENGNLIQKAGCPRRLPGTRQRPLLLSTFCFCPLQVQQKMSDNEVREGEIYEWKKKVTEAECKIKQQEHVLESVVGERNLYSKNLIESQVCKPSSVGFSSLICLHLCIKITQWFSFSALCQDLTGTVSLHFLTAQRKCMYVSCIPQCIRRAVKNHWLLTVQTVSKVIEHFNKVYTEKEK